MAGELIMPQLGLTMTEGTVSQWLKQEGDADKKGDGIVEVETDKINNIVEAPEDGVLLKIVAQEGDVLPVKGVLGYIGAAGEVVAAAAAKSTDGTSGEAVEKAAAATSGRSAEKSKKRIIVIGAGPGGYVTAIKAAQLGADVSVIEEDHVGGTCLNVGCIPTKALIHVSSLYDSIIREAGTVGVHVTGAAVDWSEAVKYKESVVKRLVGGVDSLLKANGVKKYTGHGRIIDAHTVDAAGEELTADYIILATGSEPVYLKLPGADLPGVLDSTQALALTKIPKSIVIIGGGVIGIEFAAMFAAVGAKCTIVEALPYILPPVDKEIVALVQGDLEKRGIEVAVNSKVESIERQDGLLTVYAKRQEEDLAVTGEAVIVAVGRRPRTANIGLEDAGVVLERGRIVTDEHFRTSVPGIFAVGDCNGKLMLAHAASAQGVAAVEYIMRGEGSFEEATAPACIYLEPEVAGVGLREDEAAAKGIEYKAGRFMLSGNGKSLIENGGVGMIKIIADAKYGEVLGVHMYGPRVTELIAACSLAIRLEATVDELISTIWAHPSVGEAIGEAALDVFQASIHWPPERK